MPYCSVCGKEVKAGAKFCSSCGVTIGNVKPKKEFNDIEKKKSHGWRWFWVVLVIIVVGVIGFIYFSGQHSTGSFTDVVKEIKSPKLSVENLDGSFEWSFSKGCYGTIRGTVYNQGNADAQNTFVQCNVYKNTGGLLTSGSAQVGTVYPNGNQAFQLDIDFSCLSKVSEKDAMLDCKADCSNC